MKYRVSLTLDGEIDINEDEDPEEYLCAWSMDLKPPFSSNPDLLIEELERVKKP